MKTPLFPPLVLACLGGLAAAAPVPLPVTLDTAARAVRVERDPLTDALRRELAEKEFTVPAMPRAELEGMTYHYRVRSLDWDGEVGDEAFYASGHLYTQGYVHGRTLLLTNSGSGEEAMRMVLIAEGEPAREIELKADPARQRVPRSEAGWHLAEGLRGHGDSVILELGAQTEARCSLYWYYDAEEKERHYYNALAGADKGGLEEKSALFHNIGWTAFGSGSSLPQPQDAGKPTAGAEELPTTHEGAEHELRVEYLPVEQAEGGADDAPCHRYIVRQAVLNGMRLSFDSRFRYSRGYACGGLLLLSTSGAHSGRLEGEPMAFAVVDMKNARVLEDELAFAPREYEVSTGACQVCWDGVDEEGEWCGGIYHYLDWHRMHAVKGGASGIAVRLGGSVPNPCRLLWQYDAASGKTRLLGGQQGGLACGGLPHRCRELQAEVGYAVVPRPPRHEATPASTPAPAGGLQ